MFNFEEVVLEKIAVHSVGNKQREEELRLSKSLINLDDSIKELLHKYFLSPFKTESYYHFFHDTDLNMNEIYTYVSKVFNEPESFYEQSLNMARHLYEQTNHPKIKGGELYVVLFRDCVIDDEIGDAIGLFKSENKDTYLKVFQKNENFEIEYENGVNINKLDKGCLIFNTESDLGYKVCIIDALNKGNEAQFWKDDFLKLKPRADDFYHTQNYMSLCKNFVEEVYNEENNVEKSEQIELLNKSVNYFKEKDHFDAVEFETEVLKGDEEVVKSFKNYKQQYEEEKNTELAEDFSISDDAVKNQKRNFKSVLKLDKSFHVYIHGTCDNLVKGFDKDRNMQYYQLFFEEES